MTLRTRITLVIAGLGLAATVVFAVYSYRRGAEEVTARAQESAGNLLSRSIEMFMVSTRRYDAEFEAAATAEEKQKILDDWKRTIAAVDTAVIHDFGEGQNRVRLIGDEQLVGFKPLGGDAVRPEIPFETERSGPSRVEPTSTRQKKRA